MPAYSAHTHVQVCTPPPPPHPHVHTQYTRLYTWNYLEEYHTLQYFFHVRPQRLQRREGLFQPRARNLAVKQSTPNLCMRAWCCDDGVKSPRHILVPRACGVMAFLVCVCVCVCACVRACVCVCGVMVFLMHNVSAFGSWIIKTFDQHSNWELHPCVYL